MKMKISYQILKPEMERIYYNEIHKCRMLILIFYFNKKIKEVKYATLRLKILKKKAFTLKFDFFVTIRASLIKELISSKVNHPLESPLKWVITKVIYSFYLTRIL